MGAIPTATERLSKAYEDLRDVRDNLQQIDLHPEGPATTFVVEAAVEQLQGLINILRRAADRSAR